MADGRSSGIAVVRAPRSRPLVLSGGAVAWGAVAAGAALLLARIVPDVHGKPLFEDEAVAGLVAARPLPEVLETVMWERGGGPLHFVLAHASLALEPSPYALRWLSVVFALATLPLCYELGRRLAGPLAGATAAVVAATSSLLAVYGSFARMYALYAFLSALALLLFVRAVERRTGRAALAAALAAWLLPAVHPYGAILVAAEAVVALVLWRGRPLRPALPVAAVALAMLPFAWADARLAQRFGVGVDGEEQLAAPGDAWSQLGRALAASAGGESWTAAVALVLVAGGMVVLARRRPAFVAVALLALVLPPVLLVLVRSGTEPGLSPRHLIYALPLVAAFVGALVARVLAERGTAVRIGALALLAALAVLAPLGGIRDPRNWRNDVLAGGPPELALGSEQRLAAPAAWLEATVEEGDVLYPYSAVFLAALPAAADAHTLPYSQRELILRSLERVETPVARIVVSVPSGSSRLDREGLRRRLGPGFRAHAFGGWLLLEGEGPFVDDHDVLVTVYHALAAARDSLSGPRFELRWYFRVTLSTLCGAVRETWGDRCPLRLVPGPPASATATTAAAERGGRHCRVGTNQTPPPVSTRSGSPGSQGIRVTATPSAPASPRPGGTTPFAAPCGAST
ncbi:MAG TPA: glycosyltransferase family 39 protein [Gaiellaceae bacterium]|nr:glycosyltransferase family 39 protein [Gaiellaceae bacterium]